VGDRPSKNQAIYAHLGYRETGRWTEAGYQRVFMEQDLTQARPDIALKA